MSWVWSILVALISGVACGAAALWASVNAVRWYRVTTFEGAAGYAAVGLALLGAVAGLVAALIAARVAAAMGWSGFGGQLMWGLGVSLALVGVAAGVARLLADVPPTLDGRELDLLVELRFPADQAERPTFDEGRPIELGALASTRRLVRVRKIGAVDMASARREDGRWIVPGRAPLFTARGKRILLVNLGEASEGFQVPVPAHPGERDTAWSAWLPKRRPDGAAPVNRIEYRWRVERRAE